MRLVARSPQDRVESYDNSDWNSRLSAALRDRLGADTAVERSVNCIPGLWVSFSVDNTQWWLWLVRSRVEQGMNSNAWLVWFAVLAGGVLIGAALLARLVNRPRDSLAKAARQVSKGDYASSRLDESVRQSEVYTVNVRFNHMAEQLVRTERDRAQMLAGISHDLRTPLARLRLEMEMSVPDEIARDNMVADIGQVSTTLNKFLDYARPARSELSVVDLRRLVRRCAIPFARLEDMTVQIDIPPRLHVLADEVELGRVMDNLLENAHRYGRTPGTGFTRVRIASTVRDGWARVRVRDYGEGVPEAQLDQLTRPFFRGDTARQNVAGTGLGLAIGARMIDAMGGQMRFVNAPSGGLLVLMRLQLIDGPGRAWAEGKRGRRPHRRN
jgi:two-component system osmolarity sensor histidine kinase EnvZ